MYSFFESQASPAHLGRALRPFIQDKKIVQTAYNFSLRFSIKLEVTWLIEWNVYEAR